ncbi:MAG: peroxiredoxin [Candidatus Methylomirabilia bacterium]
MLRIGTNAPGFTLPGVHHDRVLQFRLTDFEDRWLVLFFYPADFSFVCPTEVTGFNRLYPEFRGSGAEVFGVSVDSVELHQKWIQELGGIAYPLLSDEPREVSLAYDLLDEDSGRAQRGTYILSPGGIVDYALVSHANVGRSVEETLRVLRALQTGRQCPADWHPEPPGP